MAAWSKSRIGCVVAVASVAAVASLCGMCLLGAVFFQTAVARTRAAAIASTVIYEQDVVYGDGGGTPLLLDIARPKNGAGPFPAVVCIHGGGWRGGDKSSFTALVQTLAQRGYVAVTIKYRFAPADRFPAQIEDAKCAVRYLRANAARLAIDPDRIGALGGSAGGHLALLLGTTEPEDGLEGAGGHEGLSSEVQAVGSLAGPVDLGQPFPEIVEGMLMDLVGGPHEQAAEKLRQASPITYLSADDPPIMLIHGTLDELVPYQQATGLIEACQQVGVEAELITIQNGGHGSGGAPRDWLDANERLIEFFDRELKH